MSYSSPHRESGLRYGIRQLASQGEPLIGNETFQLQSPTIRIASHQTQLLGKALESHLSFLRSMKRVLQPLV